MNKKNKSNLKSFIERIICFIKSSFSFDFSCKKNQETELNNQSKELIKTLTKEEWYKKAKAFEININDINDVNIEHILRGFLFSLRLNTLIEDNKRQNIEEFFDRFYKDSNWLRMSRLNENFLLLINELEKILFNNSIKENSDLIKEKLLRNKLDISVIENIGFDKLIMLINSEESTVQRTILFSNFIKLLNNSDFDFNDTDEKLKRLFDNLRLEYIICFVKYDVLLELNDEYLYNINGSSNKEIRNYIENEEKYLNFFNFYKFGFDTLKIVANNIAISLKKDIIDKDSFIYALKKLGHYDFNSLNESEYSLLKEMNLEFEEENDKKETKIDCNYFELNNKLLPLSDEFQKLERKAKKLENFRIFSLKKESKKEITSLREIFARSGFLTTMLYIAKGFAIEEKSIKITLEHISKALELLYFSRELTNQNVIALVKVISKVDNKGNTKKAKNYFEMGINDQQKKDYEESAREFKELFEEYLDYNQNVKVFSFEKEIDISTDKDSAYYNVCEEFANNLYNADLYNEAYKYFKIYLENNPHNMKIVTNAIICLEEEERFQEIIDNHEHHIKRNLDKVAYNTKFIEEKIINEHGTEKKDILISFDRLTRAYKSVALNDDQLINPNLIQKAIEIWEYTIKAAAYGIRDTDTLNFYAYDVPKLIWAYEQLNLEDEITNFKELHQKKYVPVIIQAISKKEYGEEVKQLFNEYTNSDDESEEFKRKTKIFEEYFVNPCKIDQMLPNAKKGKYITLLLFAKYEALQSKATLITIEHLELASAYLCFEDDARKIFIQNDLKIVSQKKEYTENMLEETITSESIGYEAKVKEVVKQFKENLDTHYFNFYQGGCCKEKYRTLFLLAKYCAIENENDKITKKHLEIASSFLNFEENAKNIFDKFKLNISNNKMQTTNEMFKKAYEAEKVPWGDGVKEVYDLFKEKSDEYFFELYCNLNSLSNISEDKENLLKVMENIDVNKTSSSDEEFIGEIQDETQYDVTEIEDTIVEMQKENLDVENFEDAKEKSKITGKDLLLIAKYFAIKEQSTEIEISHIHRATQSIEIIYTELANLLPKNMDIEYGINIDEAIKEANTTGKMYPSEDCKESKIYKLIKNNKETVVGCTRQN